MRLRCRLRAHHQLAGTPDKRHDDGDSVGVRGAYFETDRHHAPHVAFRHPADDSRSVHIQIETDARDSLGGKPSMLRGRTFHFLLEQCPGLGNHRGDANRGICGRTPYPFVEKEEAPQ